MEIKRDVYLQALIDRMHNGLIKVITGIRRSGKSYLLLELFKKYLLAQGVQEDHMLIFILDQYRNRKFRNPETMLDYIEANVTQDGQYYIFIDEVQMLENFEEVLNSLLYMKNLDVYVTGSNSRFLSKDIITEFRGRGDEVHVYPLSFREFMSVYPGDQYHGWADYVTYGGLPYVLTMKTPAQKMSYLQKLFAETYLKDILERNKVDKLQELDDLLNVLASAVGSLTNPPKLQATFQSIFHSDISLNTIRQYIEYLENAFIISSAQRYDVKGRKYIGSPLKYYFQDLGLRNARLGFRQVEETHLMENLIYNELKLRGYNVDVGVVNRTEKNGNGKQERSRLEIDFVANLGNKRYYIQSAFNLPNAEKITQEKLPLLTVRDSFKKIILVKDVINPQIDEAGITTLSVYDFLLKYNGLEL